MSVSAGQGMAAPADVWSSGDYAAVAERMIPELGARLVELAGVRGGEQVLDVATGAGNAALPAARRGARVTALDITPALLEAGARRAAAEELEIAWVHGDAQALPFADASFDRVLSCVGVQFCSDHRAAATELLRVRRPGGSVALTAWTPEGFIGQVLRAVAQATGAAGAPLSPLSWGSEAGLRDLFGDECAARAVVRREHVEMTAASATDWVDYMAQHYGPMVRARGALDPAGTWAPLRERLIEIATAHDHGGEQGFATHAEYLGVLIE